MVLRPAQRFRAMPFEADLVAGTLVRRGQRYTRLLQQGAEGSIVPDASIDARNARICHEWTQHSGGVAAFRRICCVHRPRLFVYVAWGFCFLGPGATFCSPSERRQRHRS